VYRNGDQHRTTKENMGKKKKQKQGRPVVTDVSAVRVGTAPDYDYVTSRSYAETADLLSEGEIDGLVSGNYQYMGNEGETGYTQVTLDLFLATGISGPVTASLTNSAEQLQLGFLRSIYWNDVPVVDKDGYYNFQSVNVHQVVGGPIGTLPTLSTDMNNYTGMTGDPLLDLSVQRGIGERLYGPEVASGDGEFPTDERSAKLKAGTKIDKYSKTYTILNKECSKIQVNIKINALFESLQAGPKTYKKSSQLAAQGAASAGYGDTKARTIEYAIYYQPIFDQRFQPASLGKTVDIVLDKTVLSPQQWIGPITERVTGKIDQGYIRTTIIDLSKEDLADTAFFEGWRIRIVRLTPESLTSFLRNVSFVDSIVEVYGTQLRYPYSSMIYSQFDAQTFSRIPSRAYDTRLLKIKVPNNYDPETKTYGRSDEAAAFPNASFNTKSRRRTGSNPWYFSTRAGSEKTQAFWNKPVCATLDENNWNGEFKKETFSATDITTDSNAEESKEEIFIKEWCDNPAWCFYDILTNPRYGLGEYIKEDDIDKWALYEIAQYCDVLVPDGYGGIEPRFTFNYMISSREEAFKVVNDLASAFRGIAYYANGSIMAVQDKFKNPLTQFTTSNVVNGDFNYASSAKKARHTVAIVRYNDKRNFFQPAVEYVEDEESVRRYGIREIETSALGCTSKGQARRFAKWILASEANETETVSFGVGMEGAYLKPGDVVQIYDNFRSPLKYSGRTNRVEPLVYSDDSENSDGEVTPFDGTNFDNIIVDQAISFKTDKLYKLDLLTPTYDYPTGTKELDSSNKTSRNQLQTVFFSGAHTKTYTGSLAGGDTFRSDYLVSGSGVCTQIFFNTGSAFGGTGNKFDFTNYVITGYTNDDVQGAYTAAPVSESYSGGCFSGQNLIWSCEPSAANDDEFVSGNSSDYRIVNVTENDNSSYSVSALAYSTGKYDDVENAIKFEGKNVSKIPMFPTGHVTGRQAEINEIKPLYFPYGEPKPDGAATSTALDLDIDYAWPSGYSAETDVPLLDKYLTLKVKFLPAGYESAQINTDPENSAEQFINTDTVADETLDYAICISRGANFNLPEDVGKVDGSNRLPFAVNHGNWRVYETGVELFIPGKTAGSTSKYGTYEIKKDDDGNITDAKIKDYTAEFLIYEPDIENYHVAVFALSKEGAISDGILGKIKIDAPKTDAQSFSIANAISISQLTTENIVPASSSKTTMHAIDSMEPTFGWNASFTSIMNEVKDPDHPDMGKYDDPYYELTPAQNLTDYRITIRKPSKADSINIPDSKIYLEFTGFTPAALSPDFAFKSTYNDPNVVTGLRGDAVVSPTGDSTIWKSEPAFTQITDATELAEIKEGEQNEQYFIRAEPSGYIVTNNDEDFPLREYDIVVEAHDQYGKTSSRNEVWANTIGNNESESNWAGSTTKYDIMGVSIEPPSGLIFASTGAFDNNPFTTDWLQPYEAYTQNYPYVAQTAMYPNGFLDITLQHSEGAGANAGLTVSTDEDLEKYFNNVAGLIYYYTTGDNTMTFGDGSDIQTPTKAAAFKVDLKANEGTNAYKVDSTENTNAGLIGTKANKFFGGVLSSEGLLATVDVDYELHRGYYLLNESDTLEALRLPLPKASDPRVENIQLVVGFFDELSLLRGFEADGKTAKLVGENNGTNKKTPKIFTDRDINMSTIPVDFAEPLNIVGADGKINESLAPAGTSLYMGESSIMAAGDTALAFRGWCELGILSEGLTPVRTVKDKEKKSWTRDSTQSFASLQAVEWVDLEMGKLGYPVDNKYSILGEEGIGDPLPAALLEKNCVFKNVALGQGMSVRYKVSQPSKGNSGFATQIWIEIKLTQELFKNLESSAISVFPEMDGGMGVYTSTRVDKPDSGDIIINYYMDKLRSQYAPYNGREGIGRMRVNNERRFEMNKWVPSLIKVRFGILATNQ